MGGGATVRVRGNACAVVPGAGQPCGPAGRAYSAVLRASALLPIELCTLKLTASER
ncbi:hypothetical protein RKD46_007080 [Streptomyces pseudovenezuelae]